MASGSSRSSPSGQQADARAVEDARGLRGRARASRKAKRIWRVMHWNLKARLVAVDEGVETFEEAFLAHLLDERTGMTIYEHLARDGRVELAQPLVPLLEAGDR